MIQQQAQWGINLLRRHDGPQMLFPLSPPPHSSHISCPPFSLYNNGMIFQSMSFISPLLPGENTTGEWGSHRRLDGFMYVAVVTTGWSFFPSGGVQIFLRPPWLSCVPLELNMANLAQPGSEMSVSRGFHLFYVIWHNWPPSPSPLSPAHPTKQLSVKRKENLHYSHFFHAGPG